jgi:cytoskeletal protein RodZ
VTIGDTLAAGRRQVGMTVTQVSQRTCIRETIIRGIERNDFSSCGGDFYARGHIRSIARAVGTDPEPLIDEYDATMGAPRAITAADVFQPVTPVRLRERKKPNWTAALAVALLLAVGGFAYVHFTHSPTVPSANAGTVANNRTPAKDTAKGKAVVHQEPRVLDIKVTAKRNSWVVLSSARTARTIFAGMVYAGQSLTWHLGHAVKLQVDHPAGVTVSVNGSKNRIHGGTKLPVSLYLVPESLQASGSRS